MEKIREEEDGGGKMGAGKGGGLRQYRWEEGAEGGREMEVEEEGMRMKGREE